MVTSAPPSLNSDVIRNIGKVLPWLADAPDQPDRSWFTSRNFTQASGHETRKAVADLGRNLRKRHDSTTAIITAMTAKLRTEIESIGPGSIMDPDGTGVEALEEAEAYFRTECNKLRDVQKALERAGGRSAHGVEIFDELDRLEHLFFTIIQSCQEIRWLLMINDGTLLPTTGKTFTNGMEFVSSLTAP